MRRVALVVASMVLVSGVLLTYPVSASKASQDPKGWPARKVCITYLDSHVDAQGGETFTTIRWYYVDSAADSAQFAYSRVFP
jgi:hypothetical protein